jgi:Glycolipid 2-alpha-mannosyltransferase
MMHWFAIDIWSYFQDYGEETGCKYEYIMRFDEDSFLRSPVEYDVFEFMHRHDYNYGFRLCSYEMQVTQQIWKRWRASKSPPPMRDIDLDMCGVYNNFFVAKLAFFQSSAVQRFLKFVDRQGLIYRRRLGDLMIHSMSIYAFSPAEKIHRFLDFTYEHSTVDKKTGCVMWGGIQAGYNDPKADDTINHYLEQKVLGVGCTANVTFPMEDDLSPTYQHLPLELQGKLKLKTVMAGKVELPGKGRLSG